MSGRRSRTARSRLPGWGLHLWLALCLLLAQSLGQGHRLAHQSLRLAAATPPAAVSTDAASTDSWGHALGSAECQLFDHLAQVDQASTPDHSDALLVLAASCPIALALRSATATRPSPSARGPPVLA